jgi:hypothetical protein
MNLLLIILVLVIFVVALAFWKDIRDMSARQSKRKKGATKTIENTQMVIGAKQPVKEIRK